MAILQGLFLMLSRRAGQVINTLFGWATQLLFGKVSQNQQIYISGMAFGSVAWLITLIGVAFPAVGAFLLAFVPLPKWVDHNWVRLLMLLIAALLPLGVGALGLKVLPPEKQPESGSERMKVLLRGYPYTAGLAVTLLLMTLFAPFMMLPLLAKRWTTAHVPLIVGASDYKQILGELETTLTEGGWKMVRQPATWMVRIPTQILVSLAGTMVDRFVAQELTTLTNEKLEVTLHPADLVISGKKFEVVRARALLAERLAFSSANQTWTKAANELEDRVTALWQQLRDQKIFGGSVRQELARIAQERDHKDLEFEEWEVLERQQLLVERAILDASSPSVRASGTPTRESGMKPVSANREPEKSPGPHGWLMGPALFSSFMLLGKLLPKRK